MGRTGFDPLRFSVYADDLARAVMALSVEAMGISDLRRKFRHIHGIERLTMSYGQGGKTEIYTMGDTEIEVPVSSTMEEIEAALANPFEFKKKEKPELQ